MLLSTKQTSLATTNISPTSVYSIPINKSCCFQNTFSCEHSLNSDNTVNSFPSCSDLQKTSSPALKFILSTKKSTVFKPGRFRNDKNLKSHNNNYDYLNDFKLSNNSSTDLSLTVSSSCSFQYVDSINCDDDISLFSESFSNSICISNVIDHPLANNDENEIEYNNKQSDIVIDHNYHNSFNKHLSEEDEEEEEEEEEEEFDGLQFKFKSNFNKDLSNIDNNDNHYKFFDSFKNKIRKSSLYLSAKSFYKKNDLLFNNKINIIEIPNKKLILNDLPLETYRTTYEPINESKILISNNLFYSSNNTPIYPKSRECRINPTFLRFYSNDLSIKNNYSNNILNDESIDFYQYEFINSNFEKIDDFLKYSGIDDNSLKLKIKYSLLSRDKLWSNVVLPPRNDQQFNNNIKNNYNFIKTSNDKIKDGSIIRGNGKIMPWINHSNFFNSNRICLAPSGKLPNNIQYTAKGWEDTRWMCVNNRDL